MRGKSRILIKEYDAMTDELAIMQSKNIEPYPDMVCRVDLLWNDELKQTTENEVIISRKFGNY